ncbi:MAG: hypothetical protein EOO59_04220 [Hymenobacter sp.]|nr:MAG: hypothetical protein EOO59_04220 [Hymenobacter sp.]
MSFSTPLVNFHALLAGLGLALAGSPALAQVPAPAPLAAPASRYPHAALGLGLGYGAPYGWGVDFSLLVQPKLDVNVGLGATITGAKLGVGTRYYFTPERKVSAFAGGNLVYSTGLNHVTITTNSQGTVGGSYYANPSDNIVVNFKSATLLHLRGGVRWQPIRRFALLGALGYGFVLGRDPVEYVGGNYSSSNQTLVDIFSPGGVEVSVGVAFALGPR